MKHDAVSVIELGYVQGLTNSEWVSQLCEATHAAFGVGMGAFGYLYDASGEGLVVEAPGSNWQADAFCDLANSELITLDQVVPLDVLRALYEPSPRVDLASKQAPFDSDEVRPMWEVMRPFLGSDVTDVVGVRAGGLDRRGLLLAFPLSRKQTLSARKREVLERVGAHLTAAYRLRQQLATLDQAAAILDTRGRVQHVADTELGKRRNTLADAVRRIDHARRSRLDPEASLDAWRALIDGHWSVIDHTDVDGKRFIVARRNEPLDRSRNAIRESVRQVLELAAAGYPNKLIAYELGISPASVTAHLKRGLQQLGLKSRQELIALRSCEPTRKLDGETDEA